MIRYAVSRYVECSASCSIGYPRYSRMPTVAVDVGDAAAARRRVHERRIVGAQSLVVRRRLDLAQVGRANDAVGDRDLVLLAGPVVGNGERIGHMKEESLVGMVSLRGVRLGVAVVIGDGITGDAISSIRPSRQVVVAAPLAAERPPACIDRTEATQCAQLGLAHPSNHNSQRPNPNSQLLPIPNSQRTSNDQFPTNSQNLVAVFGSSWELGVGSSWELGVGRWELERALSLQPAPADDGGRRARTP